MFYPLDLTEKAQCLLDTCKNRRLMVTAAESCTGGLLMGLLTEVSGSSAVVDRGFVTYVNESKIEMLDVPASLIDSLGAVSAPVAKAMAEGALKHSRADLAVSITGIAGPTGGTMDKPIGLVYLAATDGERLTERAEIFSGDRENIRLSAVGAALAMLQELAEGSVAGSAPAP